MKIEVGDSLENIRRHIGKEPDPIKRAKMAKRARELRGDAGFEKNILPLIRPVRIPRS